MATLIVGLILTALGLSYLGTNLGWWDSFPWFNVWLLWPIILILLGLRLLVRSAILFWIGAIIIIGLGVSMLVMAGERPLTATQTSERSWDWERSRDSHSTFKMSLNTNNAESFEATLGGIYDITIKTHDDKSIQADLSGPSSLMNHLKLNSTGSTVRLSDTQTASGADRSRGKVTGTITLPANIAFELRTSGLSNVTIHEHNAPVIIKSSGASAIRFTKSKSVNPSVELKGAGKVHFDACEGTATFELSGAGHITAENCTLEKISIDSSGAGKIDIKAGSLQDADIETSGASQITLPKPTGEINQDTSGPSSIRFR